MSALKEINGLVQLWVYSHSRQNLSYDRQSLHISSWRIPEAR